MPFSSNLCWVWALMFATASASGWPMFRVGPALGGVSGGDLSARPALVWKFKAVAPVKSAAAIAGQQVYVGSSDGFLYALQFADGKKNWAFKTGGPIESAPLYLDQKIFVGSSDSFLYALD